MTKPVPPARHSQQPMGEEIIKQFLDNQAKSIDYQTKELSLRERELNNSHAYSIKALEAQAADVTHKRNHEKSSMHSLMIFGGLIFLTCIGSIFWLIEKGEKDLAKDLIQIASAAALSGTGGYFYGKNKQKKGSSDDQE